VQCLIVKIGEIFNPFLYFRVLRIQASSAKAEKNQKSYSVFYVRAFLHYI